MSWGTCYSGSNNIHFNSPPLMADGRIYSSWKTSCTVDNELKSQMNIKSNWDYRQFLISNADSLMKHNLQSSCDNCCACIYNSKGKSDNNKYLFKSCSDTNTPFGYETSDLKNIYLSRSEQNGKLVAPILTQEQYLKSN